MRQAPVSQSPRHVTAFGRRGFVAVKVEDSAGVVIVLQGMALPESAEDRTAVGRNSEGPLEVHGGAGGGAVGEEAQSPAPQGGVPAQGLKQQGLLIYQ